MQLSGSDAAAWCMNATELDVLDWLHLRERLGDCRRLKGLEVAQLADAIGVAVTTIYRVENVKEHPVYKPDLETIAAWTEATGLTLSSFFATIEHGYESGIRTSGGSPRDRAVSPVAADAPPNFEAMGRALYDAIHGVVREQVAAPRPARSGSRKGHRKNR